MSPSRPSVKSPTTRDLYLWLITEEGRRSLDALPEPVDLRTLILETDRRGEPAARIQNPHSGTSFALMRMGDELRWEWLAPWADEALPVSHLLRESGALLTALRGKLDRIDTARVVAHRPGRRLVLRVEGQSSGRMAVYYLKGLRPRAHARARTALAGLGETPLASTLCLPSTTIDSLATSVFEQAPGISLHDRGRQAAPLSASALPRLLGSLRDGGQSLERALPTRGIEEERRSVQTQLERGQQLLPELESLLETITSMDPPLLPLDNAIVHGDLHDKQIILGPKSACVLDLDTLSLGSSWIDHANLLEHLDLRVRQGIWTAPWAASARAELLEPESEEFSRLRSLVRARLVGVYAQRPYWWRVARTLATEVDFGGGS